MGGQLLFSDDTEKMVCMVNDMMEELLDFGHGAGVVEVGEHLQR